MGKIKKIDAPILVIGLGGTGFDALMRIKKDFRDRFETEVFADGSRAEKPARTEFLEIDTDNSVPNQYKYGMKLAQDEFCNISGNIKAIHSAMKNKTYVNEWVDNKIAETEVDGDGAGAVRQISRLFLFNRVTEVTRLIEGKLKKLAAVPAGAPEKSTVIQVKVIAGMSGGTGSGTLLDVAYIIKHVARVMPCTINMEAFLIMPDITIAHIAAGDPVKQRIYRTNSYGLMKELDYWMNAADNQVELRQQYSDVLTITWSGAPFNDVWLQCAQNDQGIAIADPYNHNIEVISEYLVHCYESTDGNGGESYQAVKEGKEEDAAKAQSSFSFQSARSNQQTIVEHMFQPFPVPYKYHALGAFSNAGENRLMELKEWNMIYTEATDRMEAHPVHMDGQAPVDFCRAVLALEKAAPTSAGSVRKGYDTTHKFPMIDVNDMDRCWAETHDGAPHGAEFNSFSLNITRSYGDDKEKVKEAVWNVFVKEARLIGEDRERGPKYLLDLLQSGENSLQEQLGILLGTIESKFRLASDATGNHARQARQAFDAFKNHTNIVGIKTKDKKLFNNYMTETMDAFDACRAAGYYNSLMYALKELQKNLARFIVVLSDLVTAISRQQQVLKQQLDNTDVTSTLFDVNAMEQNLAELFAAKEKRDMFVGKMFENVMDVTLRCMAAAIEPEQLPAVLNTAIDTMRENEFIAVGGMSLTQKIAQYMHVATGQAMVAYVSETLAPRLSDGANVMFSASNAAAGLDAEHAALTSMIVVPEGEDDIADGIQNYCKGHNLTVIIKRAPSSDRIFWVNDKGGMPMYFFSQIEMLRTDYNAASKLHKGYQLFMCDTNAISESGMKDEMKQDWSRILPDPFIIRSAKEIGTKAETLVAAEKAGVLVPTYDFHEGQDKEPDLTVTKHILRPIKGVAISEQTIRTAIGAPVDVTAEKNLPLVEGSLPALQAAVEKLQAKKTELETLAAGCDNVVLKLTHATHHAIAWGEILQVKNRMVNLNPAMSTDIQEDVKNAWIETYSRAFREALSYRPNLLAELSVQGSCQSMINTAIENVDADIAELNKRIDGISDGQLNEAKVVKNAALVAKMLMHKMIATYPAQIVANPDTEDEITLFTKETEATAMLARYEEGKRFPMLVGFTAWMTHEGAEKHIVEELLETEEKKSAKLAKQRKANSDVKEAYESAEETLGDVKVALKKVKRAYDADEMEKEPYNFVSKVLKAMIDELESFIDTWADYIEE